MEVGRVGEAAKAFDDASTRGFIARKHHLDGGAELHAPDFHAGCLHSFERRHGIFVLDRKVTAVHADSDVVAKVFAGGWQVASKCRGQQRGPIGQKRSLEEFQELVARLEQAVRLRFDVEMEQGATLLPQPGQGFRDADDVPGEGTTIAIRYPRLVRQGRR